MLQLLQPQLRPGALVFTDNVFTFKADNADKRRYVADPRNGFRAVVLPLKDGMEAAVYTGAPASQRWLPRHAAVKQVDRGGDESRPQAGSHHRWCARSDHARVDRSGSLWMLVIGAQALPGFLRLAAT